MNRNTASIVALSALSIAGLVWLWQSAPDNNTESSATTHDAANHQAATGAASQLAPHSPEDADAGEGLAASLSAWRDLHRPVGYLSQEDTEALIADREAAAAALAGVIAQLEGAELDAVLDAFHGAERSRDKLVMIDGLGQNPSTDALVILEEIYASEDSYTLKSNVIRALGDSPADGHHEVLIEQMWGAEDERLQQLSAQGLYGEGVASDAMIEAVHSELPVKVRLEAIHSLGATGSDAARAALEEMAQDTGLSPRVRQYAEKELGRSFG